MSMFSFTNISLISISLTTRPLRTFQVAHVRETCLFFFVELIFESLDWISIGFFGRRDPYWPQARDVTPIGLNLRTELRTSSSFIKRFLSNSKKKNYQIRLKLFLWLSEIKLLRPEPHYLICTWYFVVH